MYRQKDLIEVNFLFPDGTFKPHMAIVISNDEMNDIDDFFYIVLISSKNYNKKHTYELNDKMTTKALSKKSFVVCHLISGYTQRDVIRKICNVREPYFTEITNKIIETIF